MDDGTPAPESKFETFFGTTMDLDFMDELLDDGCLLKVVDDFNFSHQVALSTSDRDPSQYCPSVEANIGQAACEGTIEKRFLENPHEEGRQIEEHVEAETQICAAASNSISLVQNKSSGIIELGSRLWIEPRACPGPSSSVRERLKHAVARLRDCTKDRDVLIQIWVPMKKGGKSFLTTTNQPYMLDPQCRSLASYRTVSKTYQFSAEEDSKDFIGLPGRVFLRKLPEWTPDVRFFSSEEYPRKDYAMQYNIGASLAVPVFESGSWTCLGVVEVITTNQQINYRPELEKVCKALEDVYLRSSHDFCPPSVKVCKEFCQAAAPEVSEILGSVCKTYGLPIVLTWAPCFQQGKGGCRHFDENYAHCIATVDSACFVADKDLHKFHLVCSEEYLLRGQGIVGRAFTLNKQCFAPDITSFSKTDYPFSHQAKMFGLHAAMAIPLQSSSSGSTDIVLELFFPKECRTTEEQLRMQKLLPIAIQHACQSLHVIMEKELEEDVNLKTIVPSSERQETQPILYSSSEDPSQKELSWISQMMDTQQKGKGLYVSWDCPKEETKDEFKVTTQKEFYHKQSQFQQCIQSSDLEGTNSCKNPFPESRSSGSLRKLAEKRRSKTEKTISLEVLRQYFAGSLKDAAKCVGVCPTTLKRICRQHGINRWPSRKIKKVGHSLKKLQLVIDSVQGAEGSIQLGSFYKTFPELTSPNLSQNGLFTSPNAKADLNQSNPPCQNASKSPSSSCSQSSDSSIYYFSGAEQHITTNDALAVRNAVMAEETGIDIKRTRSEAELQVLNREEPKFLSRSQSHKTLGRRPSFEPQLPITETRGQCSKDVGVLKVKATFGEDKVRFSLQPNWGFRDLQQEILKRFNIGDGCITDLKYLDDDHEWVLLTCDDDLEECRDIYRLCGSHSINMSLHQNSQPHTGNSFGSRGLM
ncbi:hypothetical protein K2173_010425 [Erythroxylum novogranatense]|uniref:Uncharacterized protein n=1 Tax=Erythroxylum novogranatense TaxID=1862640 RepID=A0AAV8TFD9_9ROSI|nr:hypothetical protein K2173_010425 [Erythroxylum novogranatense]